MDNELAFLQDTLRKSGIQTAVVPLSAPVRTVLGDSPDLLLGNIPDGEAPIGTYLGDLKPKTKYKYMDGHHLCYTVFLLTAEELFLMGPYAPSAGTIRSLLDAEGRQKVSSARQNFLEKFCSGIPVLPDNSHHFVMLDTFCERLWGSADFAEVDLEREPQQPASPINHVSDNNEALEDIQVNMQLMEKRYRYENDLMEAVAHGQINKINLLFSTFSEISFEKRTTDSLRNMKNYCVIMNTLLRKAAESGGVHPMYLDSVSSAFAVKIEQTAAITDIEGLMRDMFRTYCRLVRKHSMRDYSPLVQNTIIYIESDLSANLSLRSLAAVQKVSPGYLSTAFHRETGMTVTEYIRDKRISHAIHLLCTTHLQVQTIALHCGIVDVQYFSKLFKKATGKTPKEYRETMK